MQLTGKAEAVLQESLKPRGCGSAAAVGRIREGSGEGSGSRPVSRVLSGTVIHLGRTSPYASSDLPGSTRGPRAAARGCMPPYLVLLRVGFTLPLLLPPARCALTAPFHPYLPSRRRGRRYLFCGTFRGLAPPRRYLAPCPMEPGLSSLAMKGERDCPADSQSNSITPSEASGLDRSQTLAAPARLTPGCRSRRRRPRRDPNPARGRGGRAHSS